MTREEAVRRLRRVIGPLAKSVVGSRPSSPRQRAAAKVQAQALGAELEVLQDEVRRKVATRHEPRDLITLQHLISRLERQRDEADARARYYRVRVGENHGRFQIERARGDTWDEVFALLNQEDSSPRRRM